MPPSGKQQQRADGAYVFAHGVLGETVQPAVVDRHRVVVEEHEDFAGAVLDAEIAEPRPVERTVVAQDPEPRIAVDWRRPATPAPQDPPSRCRRPRPPGHDRRWCRTDSPRRVQANRDDPALESRPSHLTAQPQTGTANRPSTRRAPRLHAGPIPITPPQELAQKSRRVARDTHPRRVARDTHPRIVRDTHLWIARDTHPWVVRDTHP